MFLFRKETSRWNKFPEITYNGTTIEKDGTATPEQGETAQEALQKLLNDDTTPIITLPNNVELTSPLTVSKAKVIDLAGFTITNATSSFDATEQALVIVNRGGSLTINDSGANGQIVVTNNTSIYNAIKMTAKGESDGAEAKLVVNGGKIEGTYYGISGNGTRHGTSVTINGGTIGCSGLGCGIFQPQDGELIIKGGEIYGQESAVEVRAGNMVMTGGTLNCTTTFNEPQKSGNGTTMRGGVALGVARHTENKDVTVEIKGGTLNGTRYGIYEFTQDNATGKATLILTDPTYDIKVTSAAVIYNVSTLAKLQEAVNFDAKNISINLSGDITGNVTVTQKPDVKITIDGKNNSFNGAITVDGKSARYDTAALEIKNINFKSFTTDEEACINLGAKGNDNTRYTNHVTVNGCDFDAEGKVAVKSYTSGDKNLKISGCNVSAIMHSLLQVTNVEEGLQITGCHVNSKNGANLNSSLSLMMDDCTFEVRGYAVRLGVNNSGTEGGEGKTFNISNSTLKSVCEASDDAVIIFRDNAKKSTLTLTNTTLDGVREFLGNTVNTTINRN